MKLLLFYSACFVLICLLAYGVFWLAKHGSYYLWYEDLVQETVREMIDPAALRGGRHETGS